MNPCAGQCLHCTSKHSDHRAKSEGRLLINIARLYLALIQIFGRWRRNTKCASVTDHSIPMKGNAADPIQGSSPQLRVYFPHRLRWLLVSGMLVTVCRWTRNSTGFLGRRAWQGPEALREAGKAPLASSTRLCRQPQAPDLSTGRLLPGATHSAELRQRRCLQPPP